MKLLYWLMIIIPSTGLLGFIFYLLYVFGGISSIIHFLIGMAILLACVASIVFGVIKLAEDVW